MKRLGAALSLGFLLAAIPPFLLFLNGPPSIPSIDVEEFKQVLSGPLLSAESILAALGFISWVLWAYLVLVVVLRTTAVVVMRGQIDGHSFLVALTDRMAPSLLLKLVDVAVGGAMLLAPLSPPSMMHLPATAMVASVASESRASNGPVARELEAQSSYVVRPGDSLWKIAETELGSGQRWPEIFEINKDRVFPDGRVFRNARLIRPSWILWLPEDRRATPGASPEPTPNIDPSPLDSNSGKATYETGSQRLRSIPPERAPVANPSEQSPHEKATAEDVGHSSVGDPVVELPSGAALAASFGAGILASQAIALLHRRRRFRPSEPLTEMPEEPEIIVDLRRTGLASRPVNLDSACQELIAAWRQCAAGLPAILAAIEHHGGITFLIERPKELEVDSVSTSRVHFKTLHKCIQAEVVGPFIPVERRTAFEEGIYIPLGVSPGGEAVHCRLIGHGPVEVGGAAAKELLINSILASVAGRSRHEVEVFLIGDLAQFGRCAELPHVRCASRWDQADETIREVQAETLGRARLLSTKGASNLWDFLSSDCDELVPALVLAATEPPTEYRAAMDSIASQAGELGIGFFAAGWRPLETRLSLTADSVIEVESDLPLPNPLKPSFLDDQAIVDVIDVIRASDPTEEKEGPVHKRHGEILDKARTLPGRETEYFVEPHNHEASDPSPTIESPTRPFASMDDQIRIGEVGLRGSTSDNGSEPSRGRPTGDERTLQLQLAPAAANKIEVRCLGPMSISRDGTQLLDGWVKRSRELLAYLVANRQGVPKDRIIEVFWPETKLKQGEALLRDAIYHLRKQCLGEGDVKWSEDYVRRVGQNVMLGEGRWWTDIWEFEWLISKANQVDSEQATDLLRKALALYRGEFCDDGYYPWAEPHRERYRRLFIRASAKLAELHETAGDHEDAIEVLERGIDVDRFCEDLYRRLIRTEALHGRTNAARMHYQRLVSLLSEELDLEPERQTQELMNELTCQDSRPVNSFSSTNFGHKATAKTHKS